VLVKRYLDKKLTGGNAFMEDHETKEEWEAPELDILDVNNDTGLGLLTGDDLIIIGTS
jgi:hypothetical protein